MKTSSLRSCVKTVCRLVGLGAALSAAPAALAQLPGVETTTRIEPPADDRVEFEEDRITLDLCELSSYGVSNWLCWQRNGEAFASQPTFGHNVSAERVPGAGFALGGDYWQVPHPLGQTSEYWVGTFEKRPAPSSPWGLTQGDAPIGTMSSRVFGVNAGECLSFRVGGGSGRKVGLELWQVGSSAKLVASVAGANDEVMTPVLWNLQALAGKRAQLIIRDEESGRWGHINVADVELLSGLRCSSAEPPLARANVAPLPPERRPLFGIADLHAHPMLHLAYATVDWSDAEANTKRSLFWGNPGLAVEDAASRLATDLEQCDAPHWKETTTDYCLQRIRERVLEKLQPNHRAIETTPLIYADVNYRGAPDFTMWPRRNDVLHQQMHVSMLERAWKGGLRLMIATAHHNQPLYDMYNWRKSPKPLDRPLEMRNILRQRDWMIAFARANASWMKVVQTPADARRTIAEGRLAVVLGLETDQLSSQAVSELHEKGFRHFTPVHVIDTDFGGAAIYDPMFNAANAYVRREYFTAGAAPSTVTYKLPSVLALVRGENGPCEVPQEFTAERGTEARHMPSFDRPVHANARGLSELGRRGIIKAMQLGMLIDLAHASHRTTEDVLDLAAPHFYPLMNSHTGLRDAGLELGRSNTQGPDVSERNISVDQAERILIAGGMIGLGLAAPGGSDAFATNLRDALSLLPATGIALGTDSNGFVHMPGLRAFGSTRSAVRYADRPSASNARTTQPPLTRASLGERRYDVNTDGWAHYGMMPDWLQDVRNSATSASTIASTREAMGVLFRSADDFIHMWELAELMKRVPLPAANPPVMVERIRVGMRLGDDGIRDDSTVELVLRFAPGHSPIVRELAIPKGDERHAGLTTDLSFGPNEVPLADLQTIELRYRNGSPHFMYDNWRLSSLSLSFFATGARGSGELARVPHDGYGQAHFFTADQPSLIVPVMRQP
jgi:microsomal dipeptidase-like Zn-dependent dipeptidase